MNGTGLVLYGGLVLVFLSVIIVALKKHLDYRYLRREAKTLEDECRQAAYFSSSEIYNRNYRRDESEFIFSTVEDFKEENGKLRKRIRLTMAFLKPEDHKDIEPVVRECTNAKVKSAKRRRLFVHLYTTISPEL